jgi:uncharacterized membrane protein
MTGLGASVFEFLFKYRPLVFEKGELVLAWPWPVFVAVLALIALAVPTLLRYRRVAGKTRVSDRVVLSLIRVAALAVLAFILFRPMLLVSTVVPQRNFLAILVDDSRSMRIQDVDDAPRSEFVLRNLGSEESELRAELEDRFLLRFFRFSSSAQRYADTAELAFAGGRTDLAAALEGAVQEMAGLPLSGLVLVTDGAENGEGSLTETLLELKARSIPVFTVGLGREEFERDIEVRRVETPRTVLVGSTLVVEVLLAQTGFDGQQVRLDVEDDGRILSSRQVRLPRSGEAVAVRVQFRADEPGPRLIAFRVEPQDGEMVTGNNQREALIQVEDGRRKILYLEGEPRFEVKFIRRAIADDDNVQVVVLQRSADNKFLRLGVDDAEELRAGFPRTREELFAYSGLILGSVEASFFTHDQLRMIADFVSQRGGGLLTLGGRHSFSEGGYAGTPLEEALPVVLDRERGDELFAEVTIRPTPAGRNHPVLRLGEDEARSGERWDMLPPLSVRNAVGRVKPGAVTLLIGESEGLARPQAVLAHHRYGRGVAIAFTVQDSWLWQMHADVPLEDTSHETLWRQLLRWLVADVPGRVELSAPVDRMAPGEPVSVTAEVEDERYLRVNHAQVTARVTSPAGEEISLPLDWTVARDGQYSAGFVPREAGIYEIALTAELDESTSDSIVAYALAGEPNVEPFDAEMRPSLLERVAEETGGRMYTPATASALPEEIVYTEAGTTVIEEAEIWDMPILFLLLMGLIGVEWIYRRARGLK